MIPESDEIEINIFGPGYGESCLVHLGGGHWIIIDSCIDTKSGRPAALAYLEGIGVEPKDAVRAIIASHWHDDHIRGLSEIVKSCDNARFCVSAAMNNKEFLEIICAYDANKLIRSGSGTSEITKTLRVVTQRAIGRGTMKRAFASTRLVVLDESETGHRYPVNVWSLSPSSAQYDEFLKELGALLPKIGQQKTRAKIISPNHLSVVILIEIGNFTMLFGSDLEERGLENFGWSAIISDDTKPNRKSGFFKIPHHGSQTSHHDPVWKQMVDADAVCILTPWNRGTSLPTIGDVTRIQKYTQNGYSTSSPRPIALPKRPYAVEKQIRESVKLKSINLKTGHIKIRRNITNENSSTLVSMSPEALRLTDLAGLLKPKS